MKITLAEGSGGQATSDLIDSIFIKEFNNETVAALEDCAIVEGGERIAITTDSFVVTPVTYPGGDIGRLAICGTVNDMIVRGATPRYITCGFILQTGLDTEDLKKIVKSMAETAREAGVQIVAGDTKVIEGDGGLMINTTGVGIVPGGVNISSKEANVGDSVIVTGNLGDHHAAILSTRLSVKNDIKSDNAPLVDIVSKLIGAGVNIHTMRDITRGGLATVLKEIATASKVKIEIDEARLPVTDEVKGFTGLLGLDPMYMGNEGKLAILVPGNEEEKAIEIIRNADYGADAAVIGSVTESDSNGTLLLKTPLGALRQLDVLKGEGLPRIC